MEMRIYVKCFSCVPLEINVISLLESTPLRCQILCYMVLCIQKYGELNKDRKEECGYLAKCQFATISNYLDLYGIPSIHTSGYMISGLMIF